MGVNSEIEIIRPLFGILLSIISRGKFLNWDFVTDDGEQGLDFI
jgi:hypothetical protein